MLSQQEDLTIANFTNLLMPFTDIEIINKSMLLIKGQEINH